MPKCNSPQSHNITLKEAISIEGTLLMLDDTTPHVAVVVQAVLVTPLSLNRRESSPPAHLLEGEWSKSEDEFQVVATTLSDENGTYRLINLKPGRYQVRCYTLDGYVHYQKGKVLQVECGKTLRNIDFRFAPFKKGTWKTITHFDGLCSNAVFVIHQDPDGTLWFGTFGGGVSRYDGKEFVNFTTQDGLADNHVYDIHRDPYGVLWFGTLGGVSRYDGKNFVNFTMEDGLAENRVNAIHRDPDGTMWFGTNGGVSQYDGKKFVNFTIEDGLPHNRINAIHRDSNSDLWFGTGARWTNVGGGVSRYEGKKFVTLTTDDGLAHNVVLAIASDPDGTMWFGTNGGVSRYDGTEFINFTTQDGLADNLVRSIHRDRDGTMWFGTGVHPSGVKVGGGVSRYAKNNARLRLSDGKGFVNFTTSDGLAHNTVTFIHRTPDAALWFVTLNGISRYDEKRVINLTTKDGLPHNHILAIHRDPDGFLWFGTNGGGVSRYDGKGFVTLTTQDGLAHNAVRVICRDLDGFLWFGTNGGGVSRYDGKQFSNFTTKDGLADNQVWAIHCDKNGVLWFGTGVPPASGGVSRYDGKKFVTFTVKDGLVGNSVWAIHGDHDGALWFGTIEGVSRYDGKTFVNFTTKDGLADKNGLADKRVYAIGDGPDEVLWFGTVSGGVSRYNGNDFATFATSDGLAYNTVWTIHRASDGALWFGTWGGGVSRYDGIAWTSLDLRDGLASNTVEAIHEDPDGSLWFGTDGGLTHYHPSTVSPRARIVAVTTDQRYTDLDAINPATVGTRITFEYSSVDFKTHPDKRLYRYKLAGYEENWNPPTRETEADYTDLSVGEYTFSVQAIDRDGNYSEPAILSLTVQPDPVLVAMKTELNHLRREVGRKYHFDNIIGRSAPMKQVYALMEKAIDSGLTVLISGETGTGKELVAKAIHYNSPRKNQPLQELNCGAIPQDLVAGTLFGHRKGAFTGAHEDKMGLFEVASGGTVLLDEIGEMPEDAQVHLLRVLQERKIQRIGETQLRDVDALVIAITNRDLMAEVEAEHFREDLFYRLSVFPIHVPSLRERADDIPLLAEHFLQEACRQQNKDLDGFAPGVMEMLQSYAWPGNVRELEHEIYRAVALVEESSRIQTYHFSSRVTREESLIQDVLSERTGYRESLDRFSRRLVEEALRESGGNRTQAARRLKMDRSNLRALIKRLKIEV